MDASLINTLPKIATYGTDGVNSANSSKSSLKTKGTNVESFDTLLQSAMDMINNTNELTKSAEEEALNFAMGNSNNTHDLAIAQQKALTAIQYTAAVRNAVMDAYKEIMQLQF